MRSSYTLLAILFAVCAAAKAQVAPAATGPAGLPVTGTLQYDLRYSQSAQFYGGHTAQTSVASGEATYANLNQSRPFNMTYSGGDMWSLSNQSEGTGVFQRLLLSQGLTGRKWTIHGSNDVSYLPQAPTTGFSGIPGVGSLPGVPTEPDQPILTLNTRSVNNVTSASFSRILNYAISMSMSASYEILRFPDNNGLDIDSMQLGPQITWRLNALSSISGQYGYSRNSYPGYTSFTMGTQSAMMGYQRSWGPRIRTTVSAGPEWIQSSDATVVPSSTNLTMNANASYDARSRSIMLSYSRATSGGAGVTTEIGVHNDDINAAFTQQFGMNLSVSASGAYMRTQGLQLGLQQNAVTDAVFGGVSAMRRLGRYFNASASYTATHQLSNSTLPSNAINGLSQVISFGIGYSPRAMRFKR